MADRIKQGSSGVVISNTWYSDGVIVDPGTVTIGITRANGTALVVPGFATQGAGAAARTFTLTTAETGLLDELTATWTSSTHGVDTTKHEIVGDFLFTIAEAQGTKIQGGTLGQRFTVPQIADMRTTVEQALESELAYALVPRYTRETLNGSGSTTGVLTWPYVRAIRSVTIDGTAATGAVPLPWGVRLDAGFNTGYSNVVVEYEHGRNNDDREAKMVGLLMLKSWLISGPIDDRVTVQTTDAGTAVLSVPGRGGSIWGIPSADSFVKRKSLKVMVA